ncbi:hypothetical protein CPT_Stahl2 [Bacillus phage Stahl]|uniref:Uncharacterized protein n=1 Tax=Bacillus phage Stahl TaxID=1610832 RepID=A0A0E3JSX6_9CAUD|nr:hypothetical protein CPT_Stahl2 [Bacillus phage Stahl]AKA61430.1 hypothetical protein CPT_Stahl2 [Bacillus phage Stahl]
MLWIILGVYLLIGIGLTMYAIYETPLLASVWIVPVVMILFWPFFLIREIYYRIK